MEIISKYQKKTLQEITYNLTETQCRKCGHWFMIDTDFCKPAPTDDYDDYVKIYCPYCGNNWRAAI